MTDDSATKSVLSLCDRALALSGAEREAFLDEACADNPQLRSAAEAVLKAVTRAGDFLDPSVDLSDDDVDIVGSTIGHYLILEKLGEGGMGAVFLAERQEEEFTQRVALKMVRGKFLANELIERFNAERKILAGLNHPYIAALIDGGTTSSGVPYLVMEFVDGQPIDEYCDSQRLSLRERILLIQKVATAVQAAHQNLVVHRDLKPSNVLITADGIPKLLDFGIAKLIQTDEIAHHGQTTLFGRQAMTPNYASPEQILDNSVTTASDVYTLGVLAYQLLTGERPYHLETSSHRELLQKVESLTVPRASTRLDTVSSADHLSRIAADRATTLSRLRKALAGDLDNILMKALEREPDRRYVSVAAFSADLGRYLAGLPVEARVDSLAYRVRRFVARHRVGVAISAVSGTVITGALVATAFAYLQAQAARNEADERFNQVRAIANTMMFDVYDDIETVPGTNSARGTLAATAQAYLETLAAAENAPVDVLLEAAQGYARLAAILNQQTVSDTENRELGRAAWEKALALYTRITTEHPESADAFASLGRLHSSRANERLYIDNEAVAARDELELAFAAFDEATALDPDSVAIEVDRLTAKKRLADSYKWQNDYEEAHRLLNPLIDDVLATAARWPADVGALRTKGEVLQLRGENNWFRNQFEEGVLDYGQALEAFRQALEAGGPNQAIDQSLADTHWSRGNTLIEFERYDEAAADYSAAMELLAVRVARDPDDAGAARRLAILRGSMAQAVVRMGRADEAVALMTETNQWFESQAAADPETPGVQRSLAVSYHMMGNIFTDAEREDEACHWYGRTLEKWLDIDAKFGLAEFDAGQPERLRGMLADAC